MNNELPMNQEEIDTLFENENHTIKEQLATLIPEGRARIDYLKKEAKYLEGILDNLDNRLGLLFDEEFNEKRKAVVEKNRKIIKNKSDQLKRRGRNQARQKL